MAYGAIIVLRLGLALRYEEPEAKTFRSVPVAWMTQQTLRESETVVLVLLLVVACVLLLTRFPCTRKHFPMQLMMRVCRRAMVTLLFACLAYKIDLSYWDLSGRIIFDIKAWYRCYMLSPGKEAPYMANAYQLPTDLVIIVMCHACSCISTSEPILQHDVETGVLKNRWTHSRQVRLGEASAGTDGCAADIWIHYWQGHENSSRVKVGDVVSWGSLSIPVIADALAQRRAPKLTLCTVFNRADMATLQAYWLQTWIRNHVGGMDGDAQLYLYGLNTERDKQQLFSNVPKDLAEIVEIVDSSRIVNAAETSWAKESDAKMPASERDHLVWMFSLQDCLYRAKADGSTWLLPLDLDEIVDFGRYGDAPGLLSWWASTGYNAVTFGSIMHDVGHCVSGDRRHLGMSNMTSSDWLHRFPCHMRRSECDSSLVGSALEFMVGNCLGPRGRRKYILRPHDAHRLNIHTPLVWPPNSVYNMGEDNGDAVLRHLRGILSPHQDLCSKMFSQCDASRCGLDLATCMHAV